MSAGPDRRLTLYVLHTTYGKLTKIQTLISRLANLCSSNAGDVTSVFVE